MSTSAGGGSPWRRRLRRLAAVSLVVTGVDVALLCALRLGAGLPVLLADGVSVAVAACLAYPLHRAVTLAGDPKRRLVDGTRVYVVTALAAGTFDLLALRVGALATDTTTLGGLLVVKAAALAGAATMRAFTYRRLLFRRVRHDQARRAPRPSPPGAVRLTVVVPVYRERDRVAGTIAALRATLDDRLGRHDHEVVVVDDGSDDRTADVARAAGADVVLEQRVNRGKGAAVRAGVAAARGRTIAFTDADLAYPPEDLLRLLVEVEAGWDLVVGSRKHVGTWVLLRHRRARDLTSRLFNVLTELVVLGHYRDTQCGLKAFRSDVARLLFGYSRVDGFAFDVELLHLAERWHLSLLEVPVTVTERSSSTVRVGVDALRMARDVWRIRRRSQSGGYDLAADEARTLEAEGAAEMPG